MKFLKRIVIKEEFVALTGSANGAVVLGQMEYWQLRVQDANAFIEEENSRIQRVPMNPRPDPKPLLDGWIYKSALLLASELFGILSRATVAKTLRDLVAAGWLLRRTNPKNRWDSSYQYRLNLLKMKEDLEALGLPLSGWKNLAQNEQPVAQNEQPRAQNEQPLTTEITSEITSEIPPVVPHSGDESAIQLLREFKSRFSHYPSKPDPKKTKRELASASVLLASATQEEILDLAGRALADSFGGTRERASTLSQLANYWPELRARFPKPKEEVTSYKPRARFKTEQEEIADWIEYVEQCARLGKPVDETDKPECLKTSQDAPGSFEGYQDTPPPPSTGSQQAASRAGTPL